MFLENNSFYRIPNYEEAKEMVESRGDAIFYETVFELGGYKISMFNYRFVTYDDFVDPIPGKNMPSANEMRGLTFVFDKDGSYKRYILLDKFWNINQNPGSMYSVVKDYKIKFIMNKEDGSLASFFRLPNGETIGRSKMSFQSDQAIGITNIYNTDKDIKRFVDYMLDNDIVPIFEYVSPTNKIVLDYTKPDLVLLKLRDNNNGQYLDINDYQHMLNGINVANFENDKTLDDLIELAKTVEDKEGWVVSMENGKMVKIKTDWYFKAHKLHTETLDRENDVISLILNDQIDDVISQIPETDSRRDTINEINIIVNNYISRVSKIVDDAISNFDGNRKDFVYKYLKDRYFYLYMGIINGSDKIESIKDVIRKDTFRLMRARDWLKKNK